MSPLYKNRQNAGRALAFEMATSFPGGQDVLVLGLPRGGVPVAYEVALTLKAQLDVLIVRKLGVPGHEEFAMGAIAGDDVIVLDQPTIRAMDISEAALQAIIDSEQRELARREAMYRHGRAPPDIAGRRIVLVDDGLATGCTMRAAVAAVRKMQPTSITVAVPVASEEACDLIRQEVDELVCLAAPAPFRAVGVWYEHFPQTSDEEVQDLLARAG